MTRPTSMQLVRTSSAEGLERLVRDMGENPIDLFERVGLTPAQFRDPNQFIAYQKLADLLHVCSEACRAPLFGLLLGQRQQLTVLGDLPMIAARSETVGEAIAAINRFLYLHAVGVKIDQVLQGDSACIHLVIQIGSPPGIDQLMQLSIAHEAMYIAELLNADVLSQAIHLRQPGPTPAACNSDLRFHNIRFNQAFDGISFPSKLLQRPTHHNEEALTRHLQDYLVRLQSLYPDKLEDQVAEIISRMLPSGECGIEEVAATLNMRSRTLRAHLKNNGTSYRDILRATRRSLAEQRLCDEKVSITELALQLGYSEVAVFSRHFKAWTGHSPRAWRAAQRGI